LAATRYFHAERTMDFAQPRMTTQPGYDGDARVTATPQISTSVILAAMIICVIASSGLAPDTPAAPAAHRAAATPAAVRIVDPAFCQNQTWPYIDQRCLKRAETPTDQGDAVGKPVAPTQQTVAATGAQTSVAAPADNSTQSLDHAQATDRSQAPAAVSQAPPAATDGRQAAIVNPSPYVASDEPATAMPPTPRHHSHYRHHRLFFGFRF
jgi:hypothetical protein